MNGPMRISVAALIIALTVYYYRAGADQVAGSFERAVDVVSLAELDVNAGAGDVTVRRGAPGKVRISGKIVVHGGLGRSSREAEALLHRLETNPPIDLEGNRLRIGKLEHRYNHVSISYQITAPAAAAVRVHTGSGDVTVSGMTGPVAAGTGSGNVRLDDLSAAVEAHAGSGSIRAEHIGGAFTGGTGSGSLFLDQTAAGDVTVWSGSGNIELSGVDGALHARTGSGDVRILGRQDGAWQVTTGSGDLRLDLLPDAAFDLDARTGSGTISVHGPLTLSGRLDRRHVTGRVRGGGPQLLLRTGSGDIEIQ